MAQRQLVRVRSAALLAELVKAKGFTVREMGDRLPCSKSMIGALMKGTRAHCSLATGERIAEVVGVPTSVLFMPVTSMNEDTAATIMDSGRAA